MSEISFFPQRVTSFTLRAVIFPVSVRVCGKALPGSSSLHVYAMSFFNPSHGYDRFALNWMRHHSAELDCGPVSIAGKSSTVTSGSV